MTTTTARYGLTKINVLTDNVDVVTDFNNNADAIDLKLGTQVCTSSTRPSSPVQGMLAFETDTTYTRVWKGSAWQTAGNAVSTSGTRPANPIQGDEVYETDTGFTRSRGASAWNGFLPAFVNASPPANPIAGDLFYATDIDAVVRYTGSGWRITGIVPCTSTTRPSTNRGPGSAIYETDTTRLLVWNGTSWEQKAFANFVCTSGTHPASPFTGLEIFETDTGMAAVYNGSAYNYGVGQIAATQTLGVATASVTFSGIPSGIKHVKLKWRARADNAVTSEYLVIQINGITSSSYLNQKLEAQTNSTVSALALISNFQVGSIPAANGGTNYFTQGDVDINGWDDSSGQLSMQASNNSVVTSAAGFAGIYGGLMASTPSANTSIKIFSSAGNLVAGSRFSLYGWM